MCVLNRKVQNNDDVSMGKKANANEKKCERVKMHLKMCVKSPIIVCVSMCLCMERRCHECQNFSIHINFMLLPENLRERPRIVPTIKYAIIFHLVFNAHAIQITFDINSRKKREREKYMLK